LSYTSYFVRITETAEDAEGRGLFCVFCVLSAFSDSDNPLSLL